MMEVKYFSNTVSRYFIIVDAIYELSTDSLEEVIKIIRNRPIDEIMVLDTIERKWIDVETLLNISK